MIGCRSRSHVLWHTNTDWQNFDQPCFPVVEGTLLVFDVYMFRRKGGDLTQSYDKSPTPTEMSKGQSDNTNNAKNVRLNSNCGPT